MRKASCKSNAMSHAMQWEKQHACKAINMQCKVMQCKAMQRQKQHKTRLKHGHQVFPIWFSFRYCIVSNLILQNIGGWHLISRVYLWNWICAKYRRLICLCVPPVFRRLLITSPSFLSWLLFVQWLPHSGACPLECTILHCFYMVWCHVNTMTLLDVI